MTYNVPTCDVTGCPGHLGKFDSCVAEAVYVASLDSGDSTGSVDFRGALSLVHFPEDETIDIGDEMPDVMVPAGTYLVGTHTTGAVDVVRYAREEDARRLFDMESEIYGMWDDEGADEDDEDGYDLARSISRKADEIATVAQTMSGTLVSRD